MDLLWVAASYLLGSIPASYIVARAVKGIDIRRSGSGHVGGANVWAHVSFGAFLVAGLADVAKAVVAVGVGQRLGFNPWAVVGVAWAVIIGHNWSVFLRGAGGRGVSTIMGALLVLGPREALFLLLALVLGQLTGLGGIAVLLGLAGMPLLAWGIGEPLLLIVYTLGAFALHFTKKMLGSRLPWQIPPAERKQVLIYRLLFDRDTREHKASVSGKPEDEGAQGREGQAARDGER
jgi:glycerol-3-phosphate acyltransferase PlsY